MTEGNMREIVDKSLRTVDERSSSRWYPVHSESTPEHAESGCRSPRQWPTYSTSGDNSSPYLSKDGKPYPNYENPSATVPTALYSSGANGYGQTSSSSDGKTLSKCPLGYTSTSAQPEGGSHGMVGHGKVRNFIMGKAGCYWKDMWRKLDSMRQLWQLCDVTLFSCDDAMFMAHSPVLAASSEVFHNFFVNRNETSVKALDDHSMKLSNVPRDVLQVTLDFIYGNVPTTSLDFQKLLSGARILGLHGAASYCSTQGYSQPDATVEEQKSSFKPPFQVPCPVAQHKEYLTGDDMMDIGNPVGFIPGASNDMQACPQQNFGINSDNESIDLRIGQNSQNTLEESVETFPKDLDNDSTLIAENPSKPVFCDSLDPPKNTVCPMTSPRPGTTVGKSPAIAVPAIVESPAGKKAEYPILPARKRDRPPKKSMELRDISFQEFLPANHPDIMSDKLALNGRCPVLHGGGASLDPDDADEVLASASVLLDDCESVGTPQPEQEMELEDSQPVSQGKCNPTVKCPTPATKAPGGVKHFPNEAKMDYWETKTEKLTPMKKDSEEEANVYGSQGEHLGKHIENQKTESSVKYSSSHFAGAPKSRGKPDLFDYASCPEWGSDNTMGHDSDDNEQPGNQGGAGLGSYSALTSPISSSHDHSQSSAFSNINYSSSDGENCDDIRGLDGCPDNAGREITRQPLTEEEQKAAILENTRLVARLSQDSKRRYMCLAEGCGYANKHLDYLQSHMYHRHNMGCPDKQCEFCDHRYFSDGQLKTHVRRSHQDRNRVTDGSNKMCPDCGATFTTGYTLQMHLLKAHGKGRLFTCEDCEFKSPRKKDMQAHMLSQHNKYPHGVRVFSCQYCTYKCVDRNRYEEHEAKHTGEQKYTCDICGKAYTTRRGMRTHLKYHSEERPHVCEICLARFKVRSKLKDHVRLVHTHAGVKPYQCGYCQHATALRGNCNQHIKKYHPGKPVYVIDMLKNQRKHVKDYNYAKYEGDNIQITNDVTAASWASIGNASNFKPPNRNVIVVSPEDGASADSSQDNLHQAISQAIQGSHPEISVDT